MLHELLIHRGLGAIPESDTKALLDRLRDLKRKDLEIARLFQRIERDYLTIGHYNSNDKELLIAEEVLANLAQDAYLTKFAKIKNAVYVWFRRLLTRLGLVQPGMTKAEVMKDIYDLGSMLQKRATRLKKRATTANGMPSYGEQDYRLNTRIQFSAPLNSITSIPVST